MFAAKDLLLTRPSGGYVIPRSLRFRASASAYLNRTNVSSVTNNKIFTFSSWVKKSKLNTAMQLIGAEANYHAFGFWSSYAASDILEFSDGTGGAWRVNTTNLYRDPSAWYHIILSVDTTQATAANRVHIYVNGVECIYATASYPTQNTTISINTNSLVSNIGYRSGGSAFPFDGYMAEVNLVDGQALSPTNFGAINATTGVWAPIKYAGTYGANGFHLDFNSYATTAALGTDTSGNGNTWTVNNISVTAGVTYDSMIDVPTVSAAGSNYCTFNPINGAQTYPMVESDGNLTCTANASGIGASSMLGTMQFPATGHYYFEVTLTALGANSGHCIGIVDSAWIAGNVGDNPFVIVATGYGYSAYNGNKWNNTNSGGAAYGASYAVNAVIGVEVNNGTLTFYKNNVSQGSAYTGITGNYYPAVEGYLSDAWSLNCGQQGFKYTPPTGAVAICTANLPAPSILIGAAHMAATTYTGTGASQTVANTVNSSNFQPDFVWMKGRSGATDHALYDSVRGTTKDIASNTTAAETTQATGLTAFGSTGFTIGALAKINTNAATYVGWQWKGSGTTVSNTSGSITSSVSANVNAGFSVVSFNSTSATGTTATVGHGLGAVPSMIIMKNRGQNYNWEIYHISSTSTSGRLIFTTSAKLTDSNPWNQPTQAVTSSIFGYNQTWNGGANDNIVAYCFAPIAGYSAFGSYTGNGSADGPFIYCGFRPRFIMFKISSGAGNWFIRDTSRDTYNGVVNALYPNLSDAEFATSNPIDYLSNGFKLRTAASSVNGSGETIIYAAFAESPFKNSLAR